MLAIREAVPADINELCELCNEHAAYEEAKSRHDANFPSDLASLLFEENRVTCLVAEVESRLVGYATGMEQWATWTAQPYGYVDCLYLREEARAKGTGSALMQQMALQMKKHGLSQLQWQTPMANHAAIAFYTRLGARPRSKERFFWSP